MAWVGIVVVQKWCSIRSGASQISHGLALVQIGVVCVGSAKVQLWFRCGSSCCDMMAYSSGVIE